MVRGLGAILKGLKNKLGKKPATETSPVAQSVDEGIALGKQAPSPPVKVAKPPMRLEPLKNKYSGPLQMGDEMGRPEFGSQTYDWITAKGPGKFYADEWIDHLLDVAKKETKTPFGRTITTKAINPRQFEYGKNYNGMNLFNELFPGNNRGRVSIEELFDSGIAGFDKQGNLTSGLLFAAKDAGIKLRADDLTNLIKNSPVNKLKTVIYESSAQPKAVKEIQDIAADFGNKTINLQTVLTPSTREAAESSLRNAKRSLTKLFQEGDQMDPTDFKDTMEFARDDLLYLRDKVTPASSARVNQTIGKLDQKIKDMLDFRKVENQNQTNYTLAGGENYREMVVKMPGPIPRNTEPLKRYGHYANEENPVYFSRFDTRYTQDGKKVLFIHDVQSDANQSLAKQIRKAGQTGFEGNMDSVRRNPYAEEGIMDVLVSARDNLTKQIKESNDPERVRSLLARLKQNNKALKFQVEKDYSGNYRNADRRYTPFLDSTQYGNHALRMLMKRAANEGFDYVAIAPYEKVAIRMHGSYKPGNERFYGTAYGKGIEGKGEGVMPKLMKQNAKFHGSQAGTIKVAYSDPKKPYKRFSEAEDYTGTDTHQARRAKSFFEHKDASAKEVPGYTKVEANDPDLYFDAFSIKVTPSMRGPVQSYSTGGLAVDIFKPL